MARPRFLDARLVEHAKRLAAQAQSVEDLRCAQAERQRQATRPGLAVRGTFSPARARRHAVAARLARTLGLTTAEYQTARHPYAATQ